MNTIFILTVGDVAKQVVYERATRKKLVDHYNVKFLFNGQVTVKQVEECVKKKKPIFLVFDNVPEQTVRTVVNHLKKKFKTLKYYSTSSAVIDQVEHIKTVDAVLLAEQKTVEKEMEKEVA